MVSTNAGGYCMCNVAVQKQVVTRHEWVKSFYKNNYGTVVMTCLFGSQNYGLDTADSDLDTVTFAFPPYLDFIRGDEMKTVEHRFPDGGKAVLMDIRRLFKGLKKTTPNSIEWILTEYKVCEPQFNDVLSKYFTRENLFLLTHCNYYNMVAATLGVCQSLQNKSLGKTYAYLFYYHNLLLNWLDDSCDPRKYMKLESEALMTAFCAKTGLYPIEQVTLDYVQSHLKKYPYLKESLTVVHELTQTQALSLLEQFQLELSTAHLKKAVHYYEEYLNAKKDVSNV